MRINTIGRAELRVGNWIAVGAKPSRVVRILSTMVDTEVASISNKYLEGWPITGKILEKSGFKKRANDEYLFADYSLMWFKYFSHDKAWCLEIDASHDGGYETDIATIKYLHELQNLYYLITGEELIYTP